MWEWEDTLKTCKKEKKKNQKRKKLQSIYIPPNSLALLPCAALPCVSFHWAKVCKCFFLLVSQPSCWGQPGASCQATHCGVASGRLWTQLTSTCKPLCGHTGFGYLTVLGMVSFYPQCCDTSECRRKGKQAYLEKVRSCEWVFYAQQCSALGKKGQILSSATPG